MKFRAIIKTDYSKNVLKLLTGTFFAQILSILVAPILTRLYSPEDFGTFTLISSIFGLIALVTGGRYEVAILLPKKDSHAANLLILSLIINTVFLFLFYIVILLCFPFYSQSSNIIWIILLPFFVFFVGYTQAIQAWFNRNKEYNKLVLYKVLNSSINNFSAVFNGLIKIRLNGLLLGVFFANFLSFIILLFQLKKDYKFIRKSFDRKLIKLLAKKYINFPLFNTFQALLDSIQINGLVYFISYFFGAFSLGFFSLAIRILMMPMNLIGSSLAQVFFQEITSIYNKGEDLIPVMKKMLFRSILLSLPIIFLILFLAPVIFSFVFGEIWGEAGVYSQIIVPWIMLDFIRSPLSQIPLVLNKQRYLLFFSVINYILIIVLFIIGVNYKFDIKKLLMILSFMQSVYIVILIFWFFRIAKKKSTLK